MSTVSVYSYADASGNTQYADAGELNATGTWSSTGTYFAATRDSVIYSTAPYICIIDNVGDNPRRTPTRLKPAKWSILSILYEYAGTSTPTDQTVALEAYNLAVTGTNAAAAAGSIAISAYTLAQVGTNTGTAAYNLATAGSNTAWAAYQLATIGTNIPNYSAGGTMTGNLKVPNIVVGTGTVPISSAISGTIYYDMSGPAYQITTATSGFQVSAKNTSNGAEICAVIVSDGTSRSITYDGGFSWFGTQVPSTVATANKKILIDLSCISATGTDILGATSAQI